MNPMNLSAAGRKKIEGYEGYHDRLPDGRCKAYQRRYNGKLDVPTIGYGCTEGVKMGMIWTAKQAGAAFAKELAKFESGVTSLVTVDINHNEYDALVSFAYNCGLGALAKSTILKKLNKGDRRGAAKAFHAWNKAGGAVVDGLVQRRASEAALFLKPVEAHDEPTMPQTVSETKTIPPAAVACGTGLAGLTLPSLPMPPIETVGVLSAWQSTAETANSTASWAWSEPKMLAMITVVILGMWLLPKLAERFKWPV